MAETDTPTKIPAVGALSGTQRAAVLLMYLDPETSRHMLDDLSTQEIQQIGLAIADVDTIAPEVIEAVVGKFIRDMHAASMMSTTGREYALGVYPDLIDEARRPRIESTIRRQVSTEFQEYISSRPTSTVATILLDEHPQTIAVALVLMGPENAANILSEFEDSDRYEVALRMAHLKTIPGEIADDVEFGLHQSLKDHGRDRWKIAGIERAAAVLGRLDRAAQDPVMQRLTDKDVHLSDTIRRRMVVFSDLSTLSSRAVQVLLKAIDRPTLLLALRGPDVPMRTLLLSNMSKRAGADILDELEIMGPTPRATVEAAQEEIVQAALKLQEEGTLQIVGGNEEMI